MASYLPSSIQKRLLRYALLKSGLLDTKELDLDSLDISLGRQNTVELRDIGLQTERLSTLLRLPPELRLQTARILRLRLNVPADLYNGSISAEAEGIKFSVDLVDKTKHAGQEDTGKSRVKIPEHRKTHNRIGHSPPYDPGGEADTTEIPNTTDLARSFLLEEPSDQIRTLEQDYRNRRRRDSDSSFSDDGNDGEVGTGNTPGLPTFLAGFLQGIVERFSVKASNITARLRVPDVPSVDGYVTLTMNLESFELGSVDVSPGASSQRRIAIENVKLSVAGLLSTAISSPGTGKSQQEAQTTAAEALSPSAAPPDSARNDPIFTSEGRRQDPESDNTLQNSDIPDHFDIQPGEDMTAWNQRKSATSSAPSDIWSNSDRSEELAASWTADMHLTGSSRVAGDHSLVSRSSDAASVSRRNPPDYSAPTQESHTANSGNDSINLHATQTLRQFEYGRSNPDVATEVSEIESTDDMVESRIYSQQDAESMFMSAYSTAFQHTRDDTVATGVADVGTIPGRTPSESVETLPAQCNIGKDMPESLHNSTHSTQGRPATPSLTTSNIYKTAVDTEETQLSLISAIEIWIGAVSGEEVLKESFAHEVPAGAASTTRRSSQAKMPGAFSVYADQSASVRFDDPSTRDSTIRSDKRESIKINISGIFVAFEIGHIVQYVEMVKAVASRLTADVNKAQTPDSATENDSFIRLATGVCTISVVESVLDYWQQKSFDTVPSSKSPLALYLRQVVLSSHEPDSRAESALQIGKVEVTSASHRIIYFTERLSGSKSSIFPENADVSFEATKELTAVTSKSVSQYSLTTKTVVLDIPFAELEPRFSSFGGLSSLLELSTSLAGSETTSRPPTPPRPRVVHFQDTRQPPIPQREHKLNARISGVSAVVRGRAATVTMTTSTVKAVMRSEYVAATVDTVKVLGPVITVGQSPEPLELVLGNVRFEYLFSPKDADLERLLALLTPSKNKYENDDDILIDTLLRQRRKGAVVRLNVMSLAVGIPDFAAALPLQAFSEELSSLSAVTKYLPEDERPGLLTLARIQDTHVTAPVNTNFGHLKAHLRDINMAHIGLPSLFAVAVGSIAAGRPGALPIIHNFVPVAANEELPAIMARMIGDEVEPTLRLKFYNLCIEYSVSTFLALTELGQDVTTDVVLDLAASTVMDLTVAAENNLVSPSDASFSSSKHPKKLGISALFHDCMIGLQPDGEPSKAVLSLNNAKITTEAPPKDTLDVTLEIRKAGIHIADSVHAGLQHSEAIKLAPQNRLAFFFDSQGFVPVCSLMSAKVDVSITEDISKTQRSIEVDVRNDLLLIETCADSTYTLIKTLGGLAPPPPPSKEDKFRIEAMTMDEMVSSFTGDAFEKPASPPSTVFDAETTEAFTGDDELFDADLSESMYVGLDALEDPEDDLLVQPVSELETAQSLLEEDPFEFPDNPNAAKLSNRDLVKTLNEQMRSSMSGNSVDLRPFFMRKDQLDRLPGESTVLGAPFRWNTPRTEQPRIPGQDAKQALPLKLRVREVHLIWNIYDGYDWQETRQAITHAVEAVELRAEERRARRSTAPNPEDDESIIGDCLFNSIYIGVPANKEAQDIRRAINKGIDDLASETESYATSGLTKPTNISSGSGQRAPHRPRRLRLERSKAHKMAFEAKGVSADIFSYRPGGEAQNKVDLRVRDFDIFDNLPTSTWRKFMTTWRKDDEEREMAKPLIHLELNTVRPIAALSATELVIRVTISPIRLHVDQDALDFMTRFFEFKPADSSPAPPPEEQPFIQRLEVYTTEMLLDYKPKRVDYAGLRSGRYTELKNFFLLDSAAITLKHAILYGIRGFDTLNDTLNDIWMPDIKANQLPRVLSGLATVSPFVSLGRGVADVVAVPIREYRKDGRVVRSIQKGAMHLARNTTSEVARFGARLATGTQNVLVGAETLLSSHPPTTRMSGDGWTDTGDDEGDEQRRAVSAYANQPRNLVAGIKSARRHLERDLLTARDAIIAVQGEVMDAGSASGAAQAVARHAPTILLRPVIGASRAVGQTLMGAGNMLDRGAVRRMEDKYKQR